MHCIAVLTAVWWSAFALCGPTTLCGGLLHGIIPHSDLAKQRFVIGSCGRPVAGTILILGTQMLYLVYISSTSSHVPTAPELMSSAYSHLAMQLILRRNWFQS